LVSSSGSQVTSTTYSAYGTPSTTNLATAAPSPSIGYDASYTLPGVTGLDDMRARDYNPASGEFTSVDPQLAATGQPYTYAGDAPTYLSDPGGDVDTGLLMGVCGTAAADAAVLLGFGVGASVCGVSDLTSNQYGFTATGQASFLGVALFAGLSIYGQVSNANTVHDMGGPFYAANLAVAAFGGVSGEFFWGVFPGFTGVVGFAGGPGVGGGFGGSFWVQDTATYTLPGWATEFLDWFNPIPHLLSLLGWSTAKAQGVLKAAYAAAVQSNVSLLPCFRQGGGSSGLW
jgi:RHS repeat-associated protein